MSKIRTYVGSLQEGREMKVLLEEDNLGVVRVVVAFRERGQGDWGTPEEIPPA